MSTRTFPCLKLFMRQDISLQFINKYSYNELNIKNDHIKNLDFSLLVFFYKVGNPAEIGDYHVCFWNGEVIFSCQSIIKRFFESSFKWKKTSAISENRYLFFLKWCKQFSIKNKSLWSFFLLSFVDLFYFVM